ncbi:SOAT protein, partial [Polypterus senegalus]
MLNCTNSSGCEGNTTDGEEETFPGFDDPLNFAFTCVLGTMLALVVFSLGCTVEVKKLWFHICRPWGIGLGIVCQFGLMPFIGYVLSIAFALNPVHAVAVLIMGCCPGGIISNVITYWIDGDMDLRIARVYPVMEKFVQTKTALVQQSFELESLAPTPFSSLPPSLSVQQ